jgi:hypothetical protein
MMGRRRSGKSITVTAYVDTEVDVDIDVSDLSEGELKECVAEACRRGIWVGDEGLGERALHELRLGHVEIAIELLETALTPPAADITDIEKRYRKWLSERDAARAA